MNDSLEEDDGLSLREMQKRLTRTKICQAARECFIEKGVDATSIDEIAARARVARATIYLHYTGKSAILVDLLQKVERDRVQLFAALCDIDEVNVPAIRKWLQSYIDVVRDHRHSLLKMFQVGVSFHQDMDKVVAESRLLIIDRLGKRFPAFRLSDTSGPARNRKQAEGVLMILQLERFCHSVVVEDGAMDYEAGLEILSERFARFLVEG